MAKFFTFQTTGLQVDREKRRINGVAIAEAGAANSDVVDATTLQMLADLGNAGCIRARFDHPNRSDPAEIEQTLNNLLGQHVNFRIDGDKVRADSQFTGVNAALEDKVMDFAEKAPHLFGLSIVFDETPPPKGQKPKKGRQPCRPAKLYAADFVDIPAANSAGLFAAKAEEKERTMDPLDVYAKDGKFYCMADGKEYELKHSKEALAALIPDKDDDDDDDDSEKAAAKKKAQEKAVSDAEERGRTAERTYAKEFATALTSSGLTAEDATEFEATFYGRAMTDVKFFASRAIGTRATPKGEGNGGAEKTKEDNADPAKEIETATTKRFEEDPNLRRMYGCRTDDKDAPAYKTALARLISGEKQFAKDLVKGQRMVATQQ